MPRLRLVVACLHGHDHDCMRSLPPRHTNRAMLLGSTGRDPDPACRLDPRCFFRLLWEAHGHLRRVRRSTWNCAVNRRASPPLKEWGTQPSYPILSYLVLGPHTGSWSSGHTRVRVSWPCSYAPTSAHCLVHASRSFLWLCRAISLPAERERSRTHELTMSVLRQQGACCENLGSG